MGPKVVAKLFVLGVLASALVIGLALFPLGMLVAVGVFAFVAAAMMAVAWTEGDLDDLPDNWTDLW